MGVQGDNLHGEITDHEGVYKADQTTGQQPPMDIGQPLSSFPGIAYGQSSQYGAEDKTVVRKFKDHGSSIL
jgi:hypothetical protein